MGMPYRVGSGASSSYEITTLYGFDLQYRIDLHQLSGSETGFVLGLRTLFLPLKKISADLRQAAGLNSSRVIALNLAPLVGLSMRF